MRWPMYKAQYLRSFEKMIEKRREKHKTNNEYPVWKRYESDCDEATAKDVWDWWLGYDILPGQIDLLGDDKHG